MGFFYEPNLRIYNMTLVFFKAMRPYDKTNGFFENYYWYKGVAGPMSIREAQRLNAAMGGTIETINLPHINSLQEFLEAVGAEDSTILNRKGDKTLAEIAGPLTGKNDVKKIVKDHLNSSSPGPSTDDEVEERPNRVVEKHVIPVDVILNMEKGALETLAHSEEIDLPAYAIQFKELTDARNAHQFDYKQYVGEDRNSIAILRSYMLYKLSQ